MKQSVESTMDTDNPISKTNNVSVKSTADLEESSSSVNDPSNRANSNRLRHSRLMADRSLFSTLQEEIKDKTEENNKLLSNYNKQLKKADTKEQKLEITASIKQVKQQNLDLKVKMKEVTLKLKTIQKLLEQSEKKKK